ncbi:Sucrase/ferredoxin-like domain containing protein [Russula decolorans]
MTLQPVKNLGSLSARASNLAGTVPSHKAYILLHGQHSPRAFPSRLASPLLVALRQRALRWSALVNVAWVPPNGSGHVPNLSEEETDGTETYSLLAFASNRRLLRIPSVSMDNFEDTCARLNNYMERPSTGVADPYGLHLYVCTHGARDCRCGEWGGKVADALREEIFKRRQTDPTGQYSSIVLGEVGHVGGHQHAANVLVFPYGEWLGQLRPKDVPGVLDTIVKQPSSMDLTRTPLITHWRGQMGLSKEEQLERYLLASR